MQQNDRLRQLLAYVGSSADSAVTLSAIAERAGCSRREVEQAIQAARLEGVPLITSAKGCWRSQDAQEARSMAERLRIRAAHQFETAAALDRAADALEQIGQETLWAA
jgi:biotin operon repressor